MQGCIIFLNMPMRLLFSRAAATRSLSASCLLTSSACPWVSFLILTSTRKLGGKACSNRTLTPRPMTVASEQCETVGVSSTSTRERAACFVGSSGEIRWTSESLTTPNDSSDRGCSGSDIGAMRSMKHQSSDQQIHPRFSGFGHETENKLIRKPLLKQTKFNNKLQ